MKEKISSIKLHIKACEASPTPPIGPALGSKGVNIMKFCTEFNERTKSIVGLDKGTVVTVVIDIYVDKSFSFIVKTAITSNLIKELLGIAKGSSFPNKNKVGKISYAQVAEIVLRKKDDLFINSEDAAIRTIIGTVKSMGIHVDGNEYE